MACASQSHVCNKTPLVPLQPGALEEKLAAPKVALVHHAQHTVFFPITQVAAEKMSATNIILTQADLQYVHTKNI